MDSFKPVREEIENKSRQVDDERLKKWLGCTNKVFRELDDREIEPKHFDPLLKRLKSLLSGPTKYQQIRTFYADLTRQLVKDFDLVTPKHYQNTWMMLGMTMFGVPFGFMFALIFEEFTLKMVFLIMYIPVGMVIGMAIGKEKDKKAKAEGKVLNI